MLLGQILEFDTVSTFLDGDLLELFVNIFGLDTVEEEVKHEIIEVFAGAALGQVADGFEIAVLELIYGSSSDLTGEEFLLISLEEVAALGDEFERFNFILGVLN